MPCQFVEAGADLGGYDLLIIGKAALTADGPARAPRGRAMGVVGARMGGGEGEASNQEDSDVAQKIEGNS